MAVRERLVIGARLLISIDAARINRKASSLFSAVEHEIIGRELNELESEWLANPVDANGPAVSLHRAIRRSRQ